ncbi:hypothetical protein ACO0QE_004358 [Hanseniaspora vineae]
MNRHSHKSRKKSGKKIILKKLNNAVKGLLEQEKQLKETPKFSNTRIVLTTPSANEQIEVKHKADCKDSIAISKESSPFVTKLRTSELPWSRKDFIDLDSESESGGEVNKKGGLSNEGTEEPHQKDIQPINKHGVLYTMSKENKLIPKFTDDEIMEKHKQADTNMKEAWMNIIDKYSINEEEEDYNGIKSDVIDIRTGQIVEDNGHLRSLYKKNKTNGYLDDKNTIRNDKYVSKLLQGYEFRLEKSNKHLSRNHLNKGKTSLSERSGKQKTESSQHDSDSDSSDSDYIDESDVDDSDIWGDEKEDYGPQEKSHLEKKITKRDASDEESEYSESDANYTE